MITKCNFILRGSCFCEKYLNIASSDTPFIQQVRLYQLKLIKMSASLANLNHCAVPFLSRAAVNLCWYYYIFYNKQNVDHIVLLYLLIMHQQHMLCYTIPRTYNIGCAILSRVHITYAVLYCPAQL